MEALSHRVMAEIVEVENVSHVQSQGAMNLDATVMPLDMWWAPAYDRR